MTTRFEAGVVAVLTLAVVSCRTQSRAGIDAERATLERRIQGLESMMGAVDRHGRLFDPDDLVIAVRETLVQDSLAAVLPFEKTLKDTYRIRVETAEVRFEDGFAILKLNGEARLEGNVAAKAALTVHGGLDLVEIDPAGILRARVKIYAVETHTARLMGVPAPVEDLVERIGKEQLDAFAPLLAAIDIPVRLDREISLPKIGPEGGVSIEAYSVPFHARVKDVKSFHHCLWITVLIKDRILPPETTG